MTGIQDKARRLAAYWPLDALKTSDSPEFLEIVEKLHGEMPPAGLPKTGKALQRLRDHLLVILCNLACAHATDDSLYIAFQRSRSAYKADRHYRGFQFSADNVRRVTDFLHEMGYIEWHKGYPGSSQYKSQLTKMRPTDKLVALFKGTDLGTIYRDITHVETVVMKGKKKFPPKKQWKDGKRPKPKRSIITTPDNPAVKLMRANLATINSVLSRADIDIDLDLYELEELNRRLSSDPDNYKRPIDFTHKHLYRVFVDGSLQLHGRFYGGWWVGIPEGYRERIVINGMPAVELDFSELHPNILYGLEGQSPPSSGSYFLDGYPQTPEVRKFLKRFLLIMINARNAESAKGAIREAYKGKGPAPIELTNASLDPVIGELRQLHAPIQHYFDDEDTGNILMNHDSAMAEEVMLHFAKRDIPCLPVHDSFILDARYADDCWEQMRKAFAWRFGQEIPIDYQGIMDAHQRYRRQQGVLRLSDEWNEIEAELTREIKVGDPSDYY